MANSTPTKDPKNFRTQGRRTRRSSVGGWSPWPRCKDVGPADSGVTRAGSPGPGLARCEPRSVDPVSLSRRARRCRTWPGRPWTTHTHTSTTPRSTPLGHSSGGVRSLLGFSRRPFATRNVPRVRPKVRWSRTRPESGGTRGRVALYAKGPQ